MKVCSEHQVECRRTPAGYVYCPVHRREADRRYQMSEAGRKSSRDRQRRYRESERGRRVFQLYGESTHGKEVRRAYASSEKGRQSHKVASRKYKESDRGRLTSALREVRARITQKKQLRVQLYQQLLKEVSDD